METEDIVAHIDAQITAAQTEVAQLENARAILLGVDPLPDPEEAPAPRGRRKRQ